MTLNPFHNRANANDLELQKKKKKNRQKNPEEQQTTRILQYNPKSKHSKRRRLNTLKTQKHSYKVDLLSKNLNIDK